MASKLESKCSQFLWYIIILLTSYIIRFSGGFFYFDSNNIGSSRLVALANVHVVLYEILSTKFTSPFF